jgi:hypothetical protein
VEILEEMVIKEHLTRRVTILDVRHCSTKIPTKEEAIGMTTRLGELDKEEFYAKHFEFPVGMKMVPFAIDGYGRWGTMAKEWLTGFVKKAAGSDTETYNRLINDARSRISIAHARAVGKAVDNMVFGCIRDGDFTSACLPEFDAWYESKRKRKAHLSSHLRSHGSNRDVNPHKASGPRSNIINSVRRT